MWLCDPKNWNGVEMVVGASGVVGSTDESEGWSYRSASAEIVVGLSGVGVVGTAADSESWRGASYVGFE